VALALCHLVWTEFENGSSGSQSYTHAFYSPSTLSTSTRRDTRINDREMRPRDSSTNQNNQVMELNSLASGPAQKNIKIRIETIQVAVRDKEQEVGAPGI